MKPCSFVLWAFPFPSGQTTPLKVSRKNVVREVDQNNCRMCPDERMYKPFMLCGDLREHVLYPSDFARLLLIWALVNG